MYGIICDKVLYAKSGIQLNLNDEVEVGETIRIIRTDTDKASYNNYLSGLMGKIDIEGNSAKIDIGGYTSTPQAMIDKLKEAAISLLKGFISGAPIVVRYHNDGDGSSGAVALYRALSKIREMLFEDDRGVSWVMNRGIAYTTDSFYSDKTLFGSYESMERPIVVIMDFGTSPESTDAINASQGVCDIIWLDHHVPYDGFPRHMISHYINTCDIGANSSFTAGLLACMFAQVIADVSVEDLKGAALVSDYSAYANLEDKRAVRNAVILDYLTSKSDESESKPKHIDAILGNEQESEDVFRHAHGLLEEAISYGMKNISEYRNAEGIKVFVLDFSPIAKYRQEYPLPGRYSSKLQHRLESMHGSNTVTLVHYGSYISIRTCKDIAEKLDMLGIIERIKARSAGTVTGGGHMQAASIRTSREKIQETLKELLAELGIGISGD